MREAKTLTLAEMAADRVHRPRKVGDGVRRAALRLHDKLASHPPRVNDLLARQRRRYIERKAEKAAKADARKAAIAAFRVKKPRAL